MVSVSVRMDLVYCMMARLRETLTWQATTESLSRACQFSLAIVSTGLDRQ